MLFISLGGISFTASSAFQAMWMTNSSQNLKFSGAVVKCNSFRMKLNQDFDSHRFRFSRSFIDGVASLPYERLDIPALQKFCENFGTHYVSEVEMGSSALWLSTFAAAEHARLAAAGSLRFFSLASCSILPPQILSSVV